MPKQFRTSESSHLLPIPTAWHGYLAIARADHWFKNVFMLVGIVLAVFHNPSALTWSHFPVLILGIIATCLLASSNYVLNEIHDTDFDRYHPKKKFRPIPSGIVKIPLAYTEWAILAIAGLALAALVNPWFLYVSAAFIFMGIAYNVKPIRLKDLPYLDVPSESINNPIRLLLGWFLVVPSQLPSVSLLLAYWLIGAFFMATKRFAEYRTINDPQTAGNYRNSFRHYTETRLLTSMVYYVSLFALCFGIFIIKYRFEFILSAPFIIGFTSYYFHISFRQDSSVQSPEHLYREKPLVLLGLICVGVLLVLLFTDIPILYEWFKVQPPKVSRLWAFDN